MLEKIEILIVILLLLLLFYVVISWGAGGKRKSFQNSKIKNYMFGVRIIIINIVSFIILCPPSF